MSARVIRHEREGAEQQPQFVAIARRQVRPDGAKARSGLLSHESIICYPRRNSLTERVSLAL